MKKEIIYFASDFHLGNNILEESHAREKVIIKWLDDIQKDAKSIYLLGDVFDFWFEYNKVIPKGCVRILGKLAEMVDNGIDIHFFIGNHDMWVKDYFKEEIGLKIHLKNIIINEQNKEILIGHGDGLGRGDYSYKFLKLIFTAKISRFIFSMIPADIGISIAHAWSKASRKKQNKKHISLQKKDIILEYCKKKQKIQPIDYYVFGHRHSPKEITIDKKSTYINTGDWISNFTYAELRKGNLKLKKYKK